MSYRVRYWIEIGEFNPDKKESVEVADGVRVGNTDMGHADNLVVVSVMEDSYLVYTTTPDMMEHEILLQNAIVAIQHQLGCCDCETCNDD